MNARSSSRASQRSPPIPWSAARGALEGASGSRRRSPKGHRRCAPPPCQWHVSTHDGRAHADGDHGPRVNGGPRDGLLAIRGQAVTYLTSRLPSRARASTFCVVDQCGYGDNRTAMRRTRHGAGSGPAQSVPSVARLLAVMDAGYTVGDAILRDLIGEGSCFSRTADDGRPVWPLIQDVSFSQNVGRSCRRCPPTRPSTRSSSCSASRASSGWMCWRSGSIGADRG